MPPLIERGLSIRPLHVLFDILRARAGRGDQAEGLGLANTAVLFRKVMLNPGCDSRLFTCIHGRTICAGFVFYARRRDSLCNCALREQLKLLPFDARGRGFNCPATVGILALEN